MRKRFLIVTSADRGWHVDLPTYAMVPGSMLSNSPTVAHADGVFATATPAAVTAANVTVLVDFPDDEADPVTGAPSKALIARKYAGHPVYASPGWTPPAPQ